MPKKTAKEVPLLSHPLIGKRVTCDILPDASTKRKERSVTGILTSYDPTVLCIDKAWWFVSSTRNLKEA